MCLTLTLFNGNVFLIQSSDERSLRQAVLQREQLVTSDSSGPGLENCLGSYGSEVRSSTVSERQGSSVVLRAEETLRCACVEKLWD